MFFHEDLVLPSVSWHPAEREQACGSLVSSINIRLHISQVYLQSKLSSREKMKWVLCPCGKLNSEKLNVGLFSYSVIIQHCRREDIWSDASRKSILVGEKTSLCLHSLRVHRFAEISEWCKWSFCRLFCQMLVRCWNWCSFTFLHARTIFWWFFKWQRISELTA